jgi:hypothetical protein
VSKHPLFAERTDARDALQVAEAQRLMAAGTLVRDVAALAGFAE